MAFCTKCGTKLENGDKFCTKCGVGVDTMPTQQHIYQAPEVVIHNVTKRGQDVSTAFGKAFGETIGTAFGIFVIIGVIITIITLIVILSF
jgi:uncharacterized membrane protein YvbJ